MILTIALLIAGLILLVAGGDFLVRGASAVALKLSLSPLVIGLTIVAFGTSAPELIISLTSTFQGSSDIALGNVIGSNICNLALILGLSALISPIAIHRDTLRLDWPVTMGSSLVLYVIVRAGIINSYEGIVFMIFLAGYLGFVTWQSRKDKKSLESPVEELEAHEKSNTLFKNLTFIVLGCGGLFFGGELFVNAAQQFARFLGVGERVIGLTVVAIGTSLPELVASSIAAFKKQTDIAVGNLMGSNIFNILGILGITSIFKDVNVNDIIIRTDMIWMLGITLIILPMMISGKQLARTEGFILVSIYLFYTYNLVW